MFRVSMFVEDRKLATVMRMLAGHASNMEAMPVLTEDGGPVAPLRERSSAPPVNLQNMKLAKGDKFKASAVAQAMEKTGRAPKGAGAAISRWMEQKLIRRIGHGEYEVIK